MKKTKSWKISKYVATGNDFLVVDLRGNSQRKMWRENFEDCDRQKWVQKVCNRIEGVGADGLIFLEQSPEEGSAEGYEFSWDFFNSDGSSAEACGNAARVAVAFCSDESESFKSEVRFLAGKNFIKGRRINEMEYEVEFPKPQLLKLQESFDVDGEKIICDLVDTGVRHLLVLDEKNQKNLNLAKSLRSHEKLGALGGNVTFWKLRDDGKVEAITFERGVESFTLACGTGAIAAAWKRCSFQANANEKVHVLMPGGELKISFEREGGVCLSGNVRKVFQGEVFP